MRAGHAEDVRRTIDESGGKRLAAEAANVDAFLFANVNRMQARRLAANGMDPGGSDLDVLAIAEQTAEETLSHRAAANIARADKKDAFHDEKPAPCRQGKLESNGIKSTQAAAV
jgi:hypothetical protein